MWTAHYTDVENVKVDLGKGVSVRWLTNPNLGSECFMRLFELEDGGYTPCHSHDWEHDVFVLAGKGKVFDGSEEKEVGPGSVIYVPPNQEHQFKNSGTGIFRFICVIPERDENRPF